MSLLALGINHKTAPVAVREQMAFAPQRTPSALKELIAHAHVQEAAILSTCNRTEVYCETKVLASNRVIEWFQHYHQLRRIDLVPYLYLHPDQAAVRHILRVASGLDSMVLGEPQILGQMKEAYAMASKAGTIGLRLGRLFQHTFAVAKEIRTDTAIGVSPISVAFAAVSLAKQIFGDLRQTTVLLIGAGETVELAARHFFTTGIARLVVANRTVENALILAEPFHGYAIALPEIAAHLAEADIVVSSTASQLPVIGKGTVERALKKRKHRPIFMVDIAVPRDIEPEVGELDDVYLYTVDDLQEVIQENLSSRQKAAQQAEEIIETQVAHFMGWLRSLNAVATIRAYREHSERIKMQEVAKASRMLARGKPPEQVIEHLANCLTNKLMHSPSVQMRLAGIEERPELLEAARLLFNLEDEVKLT